MKNTIVVKIRGGLGNQLFQYAYGMKMKNLYPDKILVVDASYFQKKHIRSLELNKLRLSDSVKWTQKKYFIFDSLYFFYKVIDKLFFRKKNTEFFAKIFGSFFLLCDKSASNHKKISCNINNIFIAGYFQNEKDIREVRERLICDIVPINIGNETKKIEMSIKSGHSIAISIRAGNDYVRLGWPVCSKEYYLSGLKYFLDKNQKTEKIFVFSDVIDIIEKENWFEGYSVTYVKKCSVVESLYLLSQCDDFVIANSTFSWWGAYLGSNKEKRIIAPKCFFANRKMCDGGLHIPGAIYMDNFTGDII